MLVQVPWKARRIRYLQGSSKSAGQAQQVHNQEQSIKRQSLRMGGSTDLLTTTACSGHSVAR